MKIQMSRRLFLPAAVLGGVAVFAAVFLVGLTVRSVVAGPDSGPATAPPNPGHTYAQIELPAGTWPGLDADTVDGLHANEIVRRLGFSTTTLDSTGTVGTYNSVTVGVDGLPLISYFYNFYLQVAHCDNPACTSAT
ncbi:MAG: hypothetical protein JSU97_03885, partial [Dehalococcoidia bacterium]